MCAGPASAQTMMEIPHYVRFHAMSENGKYLLGVEQGYVGVYDTETGELDEYSDPTGLVGYDLGLGNMVTNDGYLVGNVNGVPAILDIKNKTWTELGVSESEKTRYSCANGITPSRKYIIGHVQTDNKQGEIQSKPVIWTLKDDGTYGMYEELPYPEKDFTGAPTKYILPNCISADGNTIAAQQVMAENGCLPMVYRRAQDGSWTYEVYDKGQCAPGTEFPEHPGTEPDVPDPYDYMTAEEAAAYKQDSTEYADSLWAYKIGDCPIRPTYWPDQLTYMSDENKSRYDEDMNDYNNTVTAYYEKLRAYRDFVYEHVAANFYTQNGVWMPSDGKYYVATGKKGWSGAGGDAALFTIGDELELYDYGDGLYGQSCTNDGDVFVTDFGTAYVYPAGSTERVTLQEWLRMKGENEAADWLDNVATGTAIVSGDGRVLSGFTGVAGSYSNWIIKLDDIPTGIDEIADDADPTAPVKVYDLQGRLIKECPRAEATSGLTKGVYVIGNKKVAVK